MKTILDLCGGTGAWSRPYKEAGYNVINVTLPHIDIREYNSPDNVHGILAAPPCTMFSMVRTTPKIPRSFEQGMELVIASLNIIWECRYKNKLAFWCLENPRGYLRQFLGKPAFTFHPYEFGHPYKKTTDLWGYFKEPKRGPVVKPIKGSITLRNDAFAPIPDDYVRPKGVRKNKIQRAITPSGFAQAFFEANP